MTGVLDLDYIFELIISRYTDQSHIERLSGPEGLLQTINSSNYREVDI